MNKTVVGVLAVVALALILSCGLIVSDSATAESDGGIVSNELSDVGSDVSESDEPADVGTILLFGAILASVITAVCVYMVYLTRDWYYVFVTAVSFVVVIVLLLFYFEVI